LFPSDEPDVAKVLGDALRRQSPSINHQQQSFNASKLRVLTPSVRLTKCERAQIPQIYRDLVSQGITPERWEREALARGASVMFDGKEFSCTTIYIWSSFSGQLKGNIFVFQPRLNDIFIESSEI